MKVMVRCYPRNLGKERTNGQKYITCAIKAAGI